MCVALGLDEVAEDCEEEVCEEEEEECVEAGAPVEALEGFTKEPNLPPCCCLGVVLFAALAALDLKMSSVSDLLELLNTPVSDPLT